MPFGVKTWLSQKLAGEGPIGRRAPAARLLLVNFFLADRH